MFAAILITLLSVASALPSNIPHECMEEIQQKYAHHLAMSRDDARDHTAIMKKVMQQIDFNKCKNVQIRIKINDAKPDSGIQNVSKTQRKPVPHNEGRKGNPYKMEYKDELREDRDEYILNVKENKEPEKIKETPQIYSSTQKNKQYKEDKSMYVEPTDGDEEYDDEIYDENSKQFYSSQTADHQNLSQPLVPQRRSNSNDYINNQQYRPQHESNFRYHNNKRQPQYNQPDLNNYYNDRRLYYDQRNSNTDSRGPDKSNISYGKASKKYSSGKKDVTQEATKFRNQNGSGDDQFYYDYESEESVKDDLKTEKGRFYNGNMMNKYNSQHNNAENTNTSHETSTVMNIQRESNTDYYDSNNANTSYGKISKNYRSDKTDVTQQATKLKNENRSRDGHFYYDFESKEFVKDDTKKKYNSNMMNKYNSTQNNTENTDINHETSTVSNVEQATYSYDITSKNRTAKIDLVSLKDAIEQKTEGDIDKDDTHANKYHKKPTNLKQNGTEKISDETSHSKNEDKRVNDYEKYTEKSTDSSDEDKEDIDYIERNEDFFTDQSKEKYSDKIEKLSKPRGKNSEKWYIDHYSTEKGTESVIDSSETSHETHRENTFSKHNEVSDIQKPDTVIINQNQNYAQTRNTSVHSDELKKKNASHANKNYKNNKSDTTTVQHVTEEDSSEQSSKDTSTESKMDQTTLNEVEQDKIIINDQTKKTNLDQKQNIVSSDITWSNDNQETNNSSETNLKNSKQSDSSVFLTQSNDDQTEDQDFILLSKKFSIMNNPISLLIKRQDTRDGNSDESSNIDIIFDAINATWQALEYIINFFFKSGG